MSDLKGKKILFIIPSYNIGGAERQASNLAMYFANKGANVSVLTVDGKKDGPLYNMLQQKGINCLTIEIDIYFFDKFKNYFPTPSNLKFIGKLREQIKKIKNVFAIINPQIIFPFCYTPNVIANNFYDAKYSFCIWNQRDLGLPPFNHSKFEKKALQNTKKIIANSNAGAECVSKSTGISVEKIKVIPNAVVTEAAQLSREAFRALYKIDAETLLLTMVANFSANKDQETVVRAMKSLAGKNCKLLLVGRFDGTEKNILNLISELGLKDKVLVLPFSNDVSGIYAASDIAIHSSLSEGLPNSLLEAMAYGLPVVASDISSHKAILKDDEHVLFAPKNANHLAERLSVLIADKDLRAKYGNENKKLVETEYTLDKVAEQYLQLVKHQLMLELNIFTYSFPYGDGEQFLYEEILVLSKDYDKINVFPLVISDKTRTLDLPKNVSVHNFENKGTNKSAGPFFKVLSSEFSHGKHLTKYISKLRYYAAHFKNANSQAENLLFFLKEHNINLNSVFYTYWFNDWTYRLAILKEKNQIKHLVTRIHGGDVYEYQHAEKNYFFPFRNFQIRQLNKIFAISEDGLNHLKTAYPSSASKLQLARLGTKDHGLNPAPSNKNEFVLVSCSTFYHYKNVGRIPEILTQLEFPVKWIHIGNDGAKEAVLSLSKKLPTNIKVEFKGHLTQAEIFDFYKNNPIDLFINVSKSEGLPVTLMEAISFGIPVMAPNVGGIKEITNEITGFLFNPNSANKELALIITSFKEKTFYREKIRKFWEDNFNAEKNYTEFSQNLKKVA